MSSVGQGDDIAIVVRSFLGDACSTSGLVGNNGNGVRDVREVGGDGGIAGDGVGVSTIGFDHFAFAFSDSPAIEFIAVLSSVGQGNDIAIVVRSFLGDACSTGGLIGNNGDGVRDVREVGGDGGRASDGVGVSAIGFDHFAFAFSYSPAVERVAVLRSVGQCDDIVVVVGACCGTSGAGGLIGNNSNGVFGLDKVGHDLIVLIDGFDGVNESFSRNSCAIDSPVFQFITRSRCGGEFHCSSCSKFGAFLFGAADRYGTGLFR